MNKLKRLLLLALTCSMMLILGGCDAEFEISIKKLNDYVDTRVDGRATTNIEASFNNGYDTINNSLTSLQSTFGELSINSGTASTTVTDVAKKMQTNMTSIFDTELSDGKDLTSFGEELSKSIYIDNRAIIGTAENNYGDGLFSYVLRIIAINVIDSLENDKPSQTLDRLDFDGTKASSIPNSEVNRALTLLGYKVTAVNIGIIAADDTAAVNAMNDGSGQIESVAAHFIENNPCMTANSGSCKSGCTHNCFKSPKYYTAAWNLNAETKANTDYMMYTLSSNTESVVGYQDNSSFTEHEFPVIVGEEEIWIYPLIHENSDDKGYDTTFNGSKKSEYNTGDFADYLLKLGSGGWSGYGAGDTWRYTRGYALHNATGFYDYCNIADDNVFDSAIYWEPNYDSNGHVTKVACIIGGIKQVDGNGPGDNYWALLRLVIDVDYLGDNGSDTVYFDITEDLAGATSLSAAQNNSYSLYKGVAVAPSIKDFVTLLDNTASTAKLVTIKSNFDSLTAYENTARITTEIQGWRNTIQLGEGSPVILNLNSSGFVEVPILDTLTNSDFDPATMSSKIINTDLYIGTFKLGTMCLETINPEIAGVSDAVGVLKNEGLTATGRTMQKFRLFTSASTSGGTAEDGLYLLYGLADVHIVTGFTANKDETSTTYTYTPEFAKSSMVLNIFDNEIYSQAGDNKVIAFSSDVTDVQLYDSSDVVINRRDFTKDWYITTSAQFISSSPALSNVKTAINKHKSPFVLNLYLEGLFCPNWVTEEPFVCLGRKISFTKNIVYTDAIIGEDTPVFNILSPDMTDTDLDSVQSHCINELLSSTVQRKKRWNEYDVNGNPTETASEIEVDAIIKLKYSKEVEKIRSYSMYDSLDTISTLQEDEIFMGEFKTDSYYYYSDAINYGRYANTQAGTRATLGYATPRLYVWCTATSVNKSLPTYLQSPQFESWKVWLNNNGYATYLGDKELDVLITELIQKIETVYDLNFNADEEGKEIILDTSGLDQLDDWINRQSEQKTNAMIDIVLRVIAIILLVYGILLLICYVIDVAVAGEGDGILKKVTFNRMMTVTGLSKEERKAMSQKNEKGTYTTRAVSIGDLLPVILVLWTVATIIIIGSAYNVVDTVLRIAEQVTQVVRGAIGKE